MDKYETKLRIEEIEKLKKRKKYKEAARLADTIEWNRIRSAATLYKVADLYKICQEYNKSRTLLEFAYERSPFAKPVLFALCEICLLCDDDNTATEYYREYCAQAPDEPGVYILRFKMVRKFGGGIAEQIEILETLKEKGRQEEWLYVLAALYEKDGQIEKCVEQCDEISIWFGPGPYVYKALELKMKYSNLTPEQQEIYSQKEIERARREAQKEAKKEARVNSDTGRMSGEKKRKTGKMPKSRDVEAEVRRRKRDEDYEEQQSQEDFHVKTINMSKYNTIDLQKELAADLQKYIGDEPSMINRVDLNSKEEESGYTGEYVSGEMPAYEEEAAVAETAPTRVLPSTQSLRAEQTVSSTQSLRAAQTAQSVQEISDAQDMDSEEVFFEDSTEDFNFQMDLPKSSEEENRRLQEFKEQYSKEMKGKVLPEGFGRLSDPSAPSSEVVSFTGDIVEEKVLEDGTVELIKHFEEGAEPEVVKVSKDRRTGQTGPIQTGTVRRRPRPEEVREQRPVRRRSDDPDYVDMLPASEEKQVSGQLNIQDILAGWEKQKKQMEATRQENFRKRTLENTGNLFADFDKEANSGLLATLENPALINSVTEQSLPEDFIKGVSVEDEKIGKKPVYLRKSDVEAVEEGLKVSSVIEAPEKEEIAVDEIPEVTYEDETVAESPAEEEVKEALVSEDLPDDETEEDIDEVIEEEIEEEFEEEISEEDEEAEEETVEEETAEPVAEEPKAAPAPVYSETVYEDEYEDEVLSEEELQDEEIVDPEAQKDNDKYFGSVTEQISGNIWDEVDNVVPTPVSSTEVVGSEPEDEPSATRMISRDEIEDSLTETSAPAEAAAATVATAAAVTAAAAVSEDASEEEDEAVPAEDDDNDENEGDQQQDLSKELKKYFDIYMYSKKMKAQIMDAAENATLAAYCGNLIVTSDSPESAEQFAKAFSRYLRSSDPNFTGKPAKISAQAVNHKDVNDIFEKATNGCVVISRAGRLTNNSVNKILSCLNQEARGVEVILYDTKNEIRKLLERGPVLERFFNCRVDIVALSTEMLAEYGRKYAMERGYSIDEMAMLAFSGRIAELKIGTHEVTITEVKEIVEDAIEHVNKPSLEKMIRTMSGTRYDENHRVILREKDFEYRSNKNRDEEEDEEEEKSAKKSKKEKK